MLDLRLRPERAARRRRPATTSTTSAIPACWICNRGQPDRPVVPPMLAADIAGGSFPAVINILLALRARDQSGQGCHIDIAMTDAMFTFAWAALALGAATGRFPKPGEMWLVGGSPRYQLYPTKDGKLVACGALEPKFWDAFTKAIALPEQFINDMRDPKATRDAVAKLIAAQDVRRMAADLCGRRLLHDNLGATGGGHARSAFRRARAVCASGRNGLGQDVPGAAAADRAGVSGDAGIEEGAEARLERLAAHQARLRGGRGHAFAHHRAAQRPDAVDHDRGQARARSAPAGNR